MTSPMTRLSVTLIPAFQDNYIYLLRSGDAVGVVDPGDAAPVVAALDAAGLKATHIFNTHHHADHIGGDAELVRRYGCTVIGHAADSHRIALDVALGDGDHVAFGETEARVIATPGHTSGHIAFWFERDLALFAGDTLFSLGCGRLFEGTAAQMWHSLSRLAALPDDALLYCGHEYTQSNARFALSVDPDNAALRQLAGEIAERRAAGRATIPARLSLEKLTNPFLRAGTPELARAVGLEGAPSEAVFAEIRRRKDQF